MSQYHLINRQNEDSPTREARSLRHFLSSINYASNSSHSVPFNSRINQSPPQTITNPPPPPHRNTNTINHENHYPTLPTINTYNYQRNPRPSSTSSYATYAAVVSSTDAPPPLPPPTTNIVENNTSHLSNEGHMLNREHIYSSLSSNLYPNIGQGATGNNGSDNNNSYTFTPLNNNYNSTLSGGTNNTKRSRYPQLIRGESSNQGGQDGGNFRRRTNPPPLPPLPHPLSASPLSWNNYGGVSEVIGSNSRRHTNPPLPLPPPPPSSSILSGNNYGGISEMIRGNTRRHANPPPSPPRPLSWNNYGGSTSNSLEDLHTVNNQAGQTNTTINVAATDHNNNINYRHHGPTNLTLGDYFEDLPVTNDIFVDYIVQDNNTTEFSAPPPNEIPWINFMRRRSDPPPPIQRHNDASATYNQNNHVEQFVRVLPPVLRQPGSYVPPPPPPSDPSSSNYRFNHPLPRHSSIGVRYNIVSHGGGLNQNQSNRRRPRRRIERIVTSISHDLRSDRNRLRDEIFSILQHLRNGGSVRLENLMMLDYSIVLNLLDFQERVDQLDRVEIDDWPLEMLLNLEERINRLETGLTEQEILNFIGREIYSEGTSTQHEMCPICHDNFVDGEQIGRLNCRHRYHLDCIKEWLEIKNICPMCKQMALEIDEEEDESDG